MRYTEWNDGLDRYTVPCLFKEDGTRIEFYCLEEPADPVINGRGERFLLQAPLCHVHGEVIDRLAELENQAKPLPLVEKKKEFFVQGYLEGIIYHCCPKCGINFGTRDEINKHHFKYCHQCGQRLKWPKKGVRL